MSDSMAPALRAGDVVVSAPADPDDVRVGDIVNITEPTGRTVTHRVVGHHGDGSLRTRVTPTPPPTRPR
jgi:hypothetical protein